MKTIKERIAPFFQKLGEHQRDRTFYEACSVPWFQFEWKQGETLPDPELVESHRLPFAKMVVVLLVGAVQIPVYLESGACGEMVHSGVVLCYTKEGDAEVAGWGKFAYLNSRQTSARMLAYVMMGVGIFCRACWHPAVHVARVCPVNAMKSVQWTRAQEHYVLLRSKHPANVAGAKREQDYDEGEVLKRMAHWVKAHERTYKHPRYKKAMGLKQWIAELWRGPKEWINKRSRQIYRWVDKKTFERKEGASDAS